jgi:oxygen-independent coproporphyrinogen III oxidase
VAGIYLHIPFCRQACHYCDFHFSTSLKIKDDLIASLHREIEMRKDYLEGRAIETIYFGGGTPSLLSTDEIKSLVDKIHQHFNVVSNPEVTLEANPDDLDRKKIKELRSTSINRLSIGIQSFRDEDLKMMNRAHESQQADYSVKLAQDCGFENITIDLIYSIPGLSDADWKINVSRAIDLHVQHVSAYSLTFEPKTYFGHLEKAKKLLPVEQEITSSHFQILTESLALAGFEHYEVSNFCKPGMESKHNTSYWKGEWYLGLGPSAHSFNGKSRQWNVANNPLYVLALTEGKLNFQGEEIDERTRLNEYLMTGLRTKWGIDTARIQQEFGLDLLKIYEEEINDYEQRGWLRNESNQIVLTSKGFLLADKIASDFFILEKEY